MDKNKKGSYWRVTEVSKSSAGSYAFKNAYQLEFINNTGLQIEVTDPQMGTVLIPANSSFCFSAHPSYPVLNVSLTINFNAAAAPTDSLIIKTTNVYGSNNENC